MTRGHGRGRRSARLEARWRRVMAAWEQSGLTARDFCRRRRINEHSFYTWRRTLRERDAERSLPATAAFAPVEVRPDPRAGAVPEALIEVVLGEAVVRVGAGADASTLRAVLAAAREVGC